MEMDGNGWKWMEMARHGAQKAEQKDQLRSALGTLDVGNSRNVGHTVVGVPLQGPHSLPAAGLPAVVCMAGGGI